MAEYCDVVTVVAIFASKHGRSSFKTSTPNSTMSSVTTLHELLVEEIKDLYDAEKQLLKALPEMARAATYPDLKQSFLDHLNETNNQVVRLEMVFERLAVPPEEKTSKAMKVLIKEGADAIGLNGPDAIRDARLIGTAQRIEHYEIAAYGTARSFAETVGENEIVDLLERTLEEEKTVDENLTRISQTVNEEANSAGTESRRL